MKLSSHSPRAEAGSPEQRRLRIRRNKGTVPALRLLERSPDPITTATGEGVSRGGSTKSTSLRSAHTEPAAALGGNPTHVDRLDKAFAALHLYVTAFFSDTAQQIPGCNLNRKHLNKLFVDLQSEAVAVIRNAPEDLRNHENWKVS